MNYTFTGIPFDPVKNSLALFLSELLFRILNHTEPDELLFLFLENSIQQLDCCESGIANFHLVFLLKLTKYLGFEPNMENGHFKYFDMMNGVFMDEKPQHPHFLSTELTEKLYEIMHVNYSSMSQLNILRNTRIKLIESIIDYYRLHITDFYGLHSLEILQSLFD
jgi:DNA repair protein RecO (recombination protein O)